MAQRGRVYDPTDADRLFVERSVMAGTTINEIADCLNITDDTLRKHFRYEIITGRARLKGEAVRVLMESLADNSLDAAKFVLSRVAGWTEKAPSEADAEAPPSLNINISPAPAVADIRVTRTDG